MGTAMRNPGQIIGYGCESATVAVGAVLVQGAADDAVKLPSGANSTEAVIGLCYQAVSTTDPNASAVINGVWQGIASGAITRGDKLVIANSSGHVASASASTPPNASIVGRALESVSNGEDVAILIGGDSLDAGLVLPFTASGSIAANTIVVAGNGVAAAPGGADPVSGVIGVALNSVTNGQTVYVQVAGRASVTDSGSGVSGGANIAVAGTNGYGKTAAPSTGANTMCVGTALATTSASGLIPVLINPFVMQGA